MKKGYYTIDNSDLYLYYIPRASISENTVEATIMLFYKKGDYKDNIVERKTYLINLNSIKHWRSYDP